VACDQRSCVVGRDALTAGNHLRLKRCVRAA
jgi:hypothetical protein